MAPQGPEGRADYCKGVDEHQTRIWKGEALWWECQSCGMLTLTGWFHDKRKGRGMETGGWLCYLQSSLVTFRDGLSCTTATQNKQTAGHPKAGTDCRTTLPSVVLRVGLEGLLLSFTLKAVRVQGILGPRTHTPNPEPPTPSPGYSRPVLPSCQSSTEVKSGVTW